MATKSLINIERQAVKGSLSERIYKELKRAIMEGEFAPGELLPEDALTDATGASRTPVREALMRLQGDGLVKIVPRKGARIQEMNAEELAELVEARILLETAFFDRAVEKISLDQVEQIKRDMTKIISEMESLEDTSPLWAKKRWEYSQLDFKFHRSLVEKIHNRFILKYYDMLLNRVVLYSHHTVIKYPEYFMESAKEHDNILNAILNGENEKAKGLIKLHINQLNKRLTKLSSMN